MELFRKSLKLTVVKGLDESQGSANVPVTLTHDSNDEYADYTEQIHMRYMSNNQIYEEILPYSNSEYTIHSKALANIGTLELAVHLIKGTTELVTNQITFEINEAPNAVSMVDPSEYNWQQLVDQYMESKLSNYTTEKKVREILDAMYPVGSVYITADKNNPGNFIGGTWEQFGQGRTLIGEGTGMMVVQVCHLLLILQVVSMHILCLYQRFPVIIIKYLLKKIAVLHYMDIII